MQVDLSKEDLINLVKGIKPYDMMECDRLTKEGLMRFSGNQWNENWDWIESELEKMEEYQLFSLYTKYK